MNERIDVLLVDEDEEVLYLTKTFLERKSERIAAETETDPKKAVERVVSEGFDCVVSDFRMPEMNGVELAVAIDEQASRPFFLFTAATEEDIDDASAVTGQVQKGAGTDHYDELVERIEAAFE